MENNYLMETYIKNTYSQVTDINKLTVDYNSYKNKYLEINTYRIKNNFKPITANNLIDLMDVKLESVLSYNQWLKIGRIVKYGIKSSHTIKVPIIKDKEIVFYKTVSVFSSNETENISSLIQLLETFNKVSNKEIISVVKYCRKKSIAYINNEIDVNIIKELLNEGVL